MRKLARSNTVAVSRLKKPEPKFWWTLHGTRPKGPATLTRHLLEISATAHVAKLALSDPTPEHISKSKRAATQEEAVANLAYHYNPKAIRMVVIVDSIIEST